MADNGHVEENQLTAVTIVLLQGRSSKVDRLQMELELFLMEHDDHDIVMGPINMSWGDRDNEEKD